MMPLAFQSADNSLHLPHFGLTLNNFDPLFIDLTARLGLDAIWLDLEHSSLTLRETENLVRIISGNGMRSIVRLPGCQRECVLKAAEMGPDILMLPMIESVIQLRDAVGHARYSPTGQRGFYGPSRALNYGLGALITELREQANAKLGLWAQVETPGAVAIMDELGSVEGIDGLFICPGDLSERYGFPGEISHPMVNRSIQAGIDTARRHKLLCGTVCLADRIQPWLGSGINLLMVGNNVAGLVSAGRALKAVIQQQVAMARSTPEVQVTQSTSTQ